MFSHGIVNRNVEQPNFDVHDHESTIISNPTGFTPFSNSLRAVAIAMWQLPDSDAEAGKRKPYLLSQRNEQPKCGNDTRSVLTAMSHNQQ